MIGKLLGHTQVQTTARYAHLARDSIQAAAARITESIGGNLLGVDSVNAPYSEGWSEVLTDSEGNHMLDILSVLKSTPWANALLQKIERHGGITYANKPLLFEARIANEIRASGVSSVEYEYHAGVGESTVDFRLHTTPDWLIEVVSIGRSCALEKATFTAGPYCETRLSSPNSSQTLDKRKQSEEGEALLVVQKIGEKILDVKSQIKFPAPSTGQYHAIVVDMRGHLDGGDIIDWRQISYGADAVHADYRKYWLDKDNRRIPLYGVWHPKNQMRFSKTARERLHAIMFVAEENYEDREIQRSSRVAFNPFLFPNMVAARSALRSFWCLSKKFSWFARDGFRF